MNTLLTTAANAANNTMSLLSPMAKSKSQRSLVIPKELRRGSGGDTGSTTGGGGGAGMGLQQQLSTHRKGSAHGSTTGGNFEKTGVKDGHDPLSPSISSYISSFTTQSRRTSLESFSSYSSDDDNDAMSTSRDYEKRRNLMQRMKSKKRLMDRLEDSSMTLHKLNLQDMELYGRSKEVRELLDACDHLFSSTASSPLPRRQLDLTLCEARVEPNPSSSSSSSAKLITISGDVGTGKSSLAMELKKPVEKRGGFFVLAKCMDSQKRKLTMRMAAGGAKNRAGTTLLLESTSVLALAIQNLCSAILDGRKNLPTTLQVEIAERIHDGFATAEIQMLTRVIPNIQQLLLDETKEKTKMQQYNSIMEESFGSLSGYDTTGFGSPSMFLSTGNVMGDSSERMQQQLSKRGMLSLSTGNLQQQAQQQQQQQMVKSSQGEKHRMQKLLVKFLRVVAGPRHPVVLVLDDVQWADEATLDFLDVLLAQRDKNQSILIVTTFRGVRNVADVAVDNSTTEGTHRYWSRFDAWTRSLDNNNNDNNSNNNSVDAGTIRNMELQNLDLETVNLIVSTALRSSYDRTLPLAEIIHAKTRGNAFFVIEFLKALVDEDILVYNFGTLQWYWVEEEIHRRLVTDNVAELLTGTLAKLPQSSQLVLQIAACLGHCFNEACLALALRKVSSHESFREFGQPSFTTSRSGEQGDYLKKLIESGLIEKTGTNYSFVHNHIEVAAINLISPEKRPLLQLLVARCLLEDATGEQLDERLLPAVDLYNAGSAFITRQNEKIALSKYNLLAAEKTLRMSFFAEAAKYIEYGLAHLGAHCWEENCYRLSLSLMSRAVEVAYCQGDFVAMRANFDKVIRQTGPFEDKVPVYVVQIRALCAQGNYQLAVALALEVLRRLDGPKFQMYPSSLAVWIELRRTRSALAQHNLESLIDLPLLQNQKRKMLFGIMTSILFATQKISINLFKLLTAHLLRGSVQYGICEDSAVAFAFYGALCSGMGDWERGSLFGEAALALCDKHNWKEALSMNLFIVYGNVAHGTRELRSILSPLYYGYEMGIETGNMEYAMYNIACHDNVALLTGGHSLSALASEIEVHGNEMGDCMQQTTRSFVYCIWQLIQNLRGIGDPTEVDGIFFTDEDNSTMVLGQDISLVYFARSLTMQLSFLLGNYTRAAELEEATMDYRKVAPGNINLPRHYFFAGLVALAMYSEGKNKRRNLNCARGIVKMMKKWLGSGMFSCLHMVQMLQAEIAVVTKRTSLAKGLLEQSIRSATLAGFLQDKALAHELAGKFFLQDASYSQPLVKYHLESALQCYTEWGALAKVEQLNDRLRSISSPPDGICE